MASCRGKRQYKRRSYAIKIMRAAPIRSVSGVPANVYRCIECGYYHIGHDFRGIANLDNTESKNGDIGS
jgi:hypothetical protein